VKTEGDFGAAMQRATRLLHSTDRLTAEIERELAGHESAIVEGVLRELQALGYLDDSRLIADHFDKRLAQKRGLLSIRAELLHRGACAESLDNAEMERLATECEYALDLARALAARGDASQRVLRRLVSRGFSESAVAYVQSELNLGEE